MAETAVKKTHVIFFFPNGNTAVCDLRTNQQIPELQQPWIRRFLSLIEENGIDLEACEINLPNGDKAEVFRHSEGWNWQVKP